MRVPTVVVVVVRTYVLTYLLPYLPTYLVRPRALPANAPSFPSQRTRVRASCDSLARGPAQSSLLESLQAFRCVRCGAFAVKLITRKVTQNFKLKKNKIYKTIPRERERERERERVVLRQDYGDRVTIAVFCAAVLREVSGLRKALCVCVCACFFFWEGGGRGVSWLFCWSKEVGNFFLVSLKREREAGTEGEREEECAFFLSFFSFF